MKTLKCLLLCVFCAAVFACTTSTADMSFALGEKGEYNTTLSYSADKARLTSATLNALSERGWNASKQGEVINAQLNRGGIDAKLAITVSDGSININSKGSVAKGRPIVPLRWIDMLKKSSAADLRRTK